MSPSEFGLHRLPDAELKRLLRALHRGALPSPITRSALIEKAFGHIEAHLDLVIGRDVAAAKALLIAVLAERGSDAVRGSSALVYAGPPAPGTRSRDTIDQVRELLASATVSAHVYGLTLDDDRGLLRTLGSLMVGRDVQVKLVFAAEPGDAQVAGRARALLASQLRGRLERLEAFVAAGARLRGRAVIVDGERVLVTSAELTGCEDDGYIDLGLLVHDRELAAAIEEEWAKLTAIGVVHRLEAPSPEP